MADQCRSARYAQAGTQGDRCDQRASYPNVFSESTVSDKPARQVARESGAHYGGVLYVDSLSAADGPVPTYLDLLRVTTQTIVNGINKGLESQP